MTYDPATDSATVGSATAVELPVPPTGCPRPY